MENKHLTFNEIMDFISVKKLNEETEKIINRVNLHIAHCEECRNLVRQYQQIKEDFEKLTNNSQGCINEVLTNDPRYMDLRNSVLAKNEEKNELSVDAQEKMSK